MHISLTINLISSLCKEIITKQYIDVNFPTLAPFPFLLQTLHDQWPILMQENRLLIFWRYAPDQFIQIVDHMSLSTFLTMTADPQLYLILIDEPRKDPDLDNFLEILDLMELKLQKEKEQNKYDLRCEADEIQAKIDKCQQLISPVCNEEGGSNDENDILKFAVRKMPLERCYTANVCSGYSLLDCIRKAMKDPIINCSPHQDIYFLDTHSKNEDNNLDNIFVSPAGREVLKYKPATKLKPKMNTNIEFLTTIQNNNRQSGLINEGHKTVEKNTPSSGTVTSLGNPSTSSTGDSRRSSIDLYEEAAAILGLSCAQTDDCRCIECQCHYFDFDEEIDFPNGGGDYSNLLNVDHTSSCTIQ